MQGRPLTEADLEAALSVNPRQAGYELVGRDRALGAWRTLLNSPSFRSHVFMTGRSGDRQRITGLAASVFVSQTFADSEVANPRPGLNARIIASTADMCPVVLNDAELRRANTYEGLNFICLYGAWRADELTSDEISELSMHFAAKSLELFAGYRLRKVLTECTNAQELSQAQAWRVFRLVHFQQRDCSDPRIPWLSPRALAICERADALAVPGSIAAILFHCQDPILELHDSDQELLQAALAGATDDCLVKQLGIKLPTLKKRWASLFDHVARVKPDLIPDSDTHLDRGKRGRQKRHHLLAYVRLHPEELRPRLRRMQR
jgi:hypothetical protein